jgi:hypothetical protein
MANVAAKTRTICSNVRVENTFANGVMEAPLLCVGTATGRPRQDRGERNVEGRLPTGTAKQTETAVDIAAPLARGLAWRRRGRDISIFDCDLRTPAGTLACGHNPLSAVRQFHPGQDHLQLRDAGRFRIRVGRQICCRKNYPETLAHFSGRLLHPSRRREIYRGALCADPLARRGV